MGIFKSKNPDECYLLSDAVEVGYFFFFLGHSWVHIGCRADGKCQNHELCTSPDYLHFSIILYLFINCITPFSFATY